MEVSSQLNTLVPEPLYTFERIHISAMSQLEKNRSHILMLSPGLPWPPTTGGSVRIDALYRGLRRHFDVTFVSAFGSWPKLEDLPEGRIETVSMPQPNPLSTLFRLLSRRAPYHHVRYASVPAQKRVRQIIEKEQVDLIYVHFLYAIQYLPRNCKIPICVDPHNVDGEYWGSKLAASKGLRRFIVSINRDRVLAYEHHILPRIQAYVCVSEDDCRKTREYATPPVPHILLAENGVDLNAYSRSPLRQSSSELVLGFLGSLDVEMNVKSVARFYQKVWPGLRVSLSAWNPRLLLIGRNPSRTLIRLIDGDTSVTVTGTVPSVIPWLEKTDILIAPLVEGAGTKLKTLESMSIGLPVVGSPIAFLGIGGKDGTHYRCVKDDKAFVAAVLELASSPERRHAIGRNARALVEERFGWDRITDCLAAQLCEHIGLVSKP